MATLGGTVGQIAFKVVADLTDFTRGLATATAEAQAFKTRMGEMQTQGNLTNETLKNMTTETSKLSQATQSIRRETQQWTGDVHGVSGALKAAEQQVAPFKTRLTEMGVVGKDADAVMNRLKTTLAHPLVAKEAMDSLRELGMSEKMAASEAEKMATSLIRTAMSTTQAAEGASSGGGAFSALGAAAASAGSMGGLAILIGAVILLTAVLAPAIAIVSAFVVGLLAMITVVTVGLGAIGALAAVISVLAMHQFQAAQTAQQGVTTATQAQQAALLQLQIAQAGVSGTQHASVSQLAALQRAHQNVTATTQQLTAAQQAQAAAGPLVANPMNQLTADLQKMATVLGVQAMPLFKVLVDWFDKLIPKIQDMGSRMIAWFGDRLPGILKAITPLVDEVFNSFDRLGGAIGKVVEFTVGGTTAPAKAAAAAVPTLPSAAASAVGEGLSAGGAGDTTSRAVRTVTAPAPAVGMGLSAGAASDASAGAVAVPPPPVTPLETFTNVLKGVTDAIIGLMQNLQRMADWWAARFPELASTGGGFFDGVGRAVQGLGDAFGRFVDWSIQQWPGWQHTLQIAFEEVGKAFGFIMENVIPTLKDMIPLIKAVADHGNELRPLAIALGVVFAIVAISLIFLGSVIIVFVGFLEVFFFAISFGIHAVQNDFNRFVAMVAGAVTAVINWFAWLYAVLIGHSIIPDIVNGIVNLFQWLWGRMNAIWAAIAGAANGAWNAIHDNIFNWASRISENIGGVFSGIGTAVRSGLSAAMGVLGGFFDALRNAPVIGFMFQWLPAGKDLPRFAQGGVVPGPMGAGDIVPALLSPGEVVLNTAAVAKMGGTGAANQLNANAHGLGANMTPGTWGGQCVVFVEAVTGQFFPVQMASQMTSYMNTNTPAPGEIFVSTLPPYGHTGIVIGNNQVIDSNWGMNEIIQIHALSDIPSIAGYISGMSAAGLPAGTAGSTGSPIAGLLDVSNKLKAMADHAITGLGEGWGAGIAKGLVSHAVDGIKSHLHLDQGGTIPPGISQVYNGTGGGEWVPGPQGQDDLKAIRASMAVLERKLMGQITINHQAAHATPAELLREASWGAFTGAI